MATICEFGSVPEQVKAGYKMVGVVVGSDEQLLADYAGDERPVCARSRYTRASRSVGVCGDAPA